MTFGNSLKLLIPGCFVIGAGMELFMIKTGFYDIVTRKEAERRAEAEKIESVKRKRLQDLRLKFDKVEKE